MIAALTTGLWLMIAPPVAQRWALPATGLRRRRDYAVLLGDPYRSLRG